MMEIPNSPPDVKKHHEMDAQFARWWMFLNGLGLFAFVLFLACSGLGDARFGSALISFFLILWIRLRGAKSFPPFIEHLRKNKSEAGKTLQKTLFREHMDKKFFHYLPAFIGIACLGGLAFAPVFWKQPSAYLAFFQLFVVP
jgi:hypothetical protein